jgi:hypothetical protein
VHAATGENTVMVWREDENEQTFVAAGGAVGE